MKKSDYCGIIIILILIIIVLILLLYRENRRYILAIENRYNLAVHEVIHHIQNVQEYFAEAVDASEAEGRIQALTRAWREVNLARIYLAQLPSAGHEIGQAKRFSNQASSYAYLLSRKGLREEVLSEEDLRELKRLHEYSVGLLERLHEFMDDMKNGAITWRELTRTIEIPFAQQVSCIESV